MSHVSHPGEVSRPATPSMERPTTPNMERPTTPSNRPFSSQSGFRPTTPGRSHPGGGMGRIDASLMPSKWLARLVMHFDRLNRCWALMKQKNPKIENQIVPIDSFYVICDRVLASGLNPKEERQLFASLDPAGTGLVDWAEFRDAVWAIVHPVAQVDGMSLPGSSAAACMDDGPRGRGGHFQYDGPVVFNNKYRQTLDETGQPLLKNIFQSKFEQTDKPVWVEEDFDVGNMGQFVKDKRSGKRVEGCTPSYLEVDKRRNVPMVQSVLQGSWYGDPNHVQTHDKVNKDFLARHLRTVRDYSRVVKSIKPAKHPPPRALQRFSTPPLPDDYVIEMPTTAGEVGEFYGQAGEEAAQGMADYLTNAPDFALRRYLRTVRGSPTSRAHWAPPPPNSASLQQAMPHRVVSGGSQPVARPRTASSAGSRARTPHQEMLRQATETARARRGGGTPNSQSGQALRPASALDKVAIIGGRPASAAAAMRTSFQGGGPASPTDNGKISAPPSGGDMYMSPGRRLGRSTSKHQPSRGAILQDKMHLDLQKSAFGASFPAKRLGTLRRQLESNAAR